MTAEAISRMEGELSRLQEAISSIQDSYGQDHLHLTVVKGYLRKLITNDRVARYLEQYQPELFIEFQKIAEMTSNRPSEILTVTTFFSGPSGIGAFALVKTSRKSYANRTIHGLGWHIAFRNTARGKLVPSRPLASAGA